MTARQDFEALMPEPAVRAVHANASNTPAVKSGHEMSGYMKSPDYFTADQLRTAIQAADKAATERAAALAPGLATDLAIKYAGGGPVDFETIAAAIREGTK